MADFVPPSPVCPTLMRPPQKGDHVVLVDGYSFIFRAYYQSIRQDARYNFRSDRLPTGAVRIFATKVLSFIREGVMGRKATHLALIFDKSENSFRKALYPEYKANRSAPPPDLVSQFPLMRAVVRAFGYEPVERDVYEADDLIATYAGEAQALGAQVTIVSADKDLMQLIGAGVCLYDPASGERGERFIQEPEVVDYFGVPPHQVIDVQALAGDSSDNIPGAPGIGIKTAAQLIGEYGSLEGLLARAHEIKQAKRRETLTNPEVIEKIKLSQKLVTLVRDVAVPVALGSLVLRPLAAEQAVAFLKALEFTTLTKRVAELYNVDFEAIAPDATYQKGVYPPQEGGAGGLQTPAPQGGEAPPADNSASDLGFTPAALAEARLAAMRALPVKLEAYETITSLTRLQEWCEAARAAGHVAFDTETTGLDAMQAELVGISLSVHPGQAAYLPLRHRQGEGLFDNGLVTGQVDFEAALAVLGPLLAEPAILKIGQNIKYDQLIMRRYGIDITPIDDTMLMSYVLDAGKNGHGMDELSRLHLGHEAISFASITAQEGKKTRAKVTFDLVAIDKATAYAAEDADVTLRLWHILKPRLVAEGMNAVYEGLERGMPACLTKMEARGIMVDRAILSQLSGQFAQEMARLEAEIHALAGEVFNLASPKQLGELLFGKMGLAGGKKTATGAWATGADVLEELADAGHVLPAKLLEWRGLQKLKSTYTDALPSFIHPQTGKVHTSFALASTTTGRLSSSDPNVQNIPVRHELGRKIRAAFVAEPGRLLISADYSQVELRLLAHIADLPSLQKAFREGIDIHAMTASEMFNVPLADMTSEIRRRAKAINFGIIYGISAFGLARQLSIGREEASGAIKRYFERFPGIKDYMEAMKAKIRADGYVSTIFGRKCHFPSITSKSAAERAFVERAAINAPIQGAAADLIRRAMLRMEAAIEAHQLSARMLLQVHDELIFDVKQEEAEIAIPVIKKVMEEAASPLLQLKVPLVVDARAAPNWEAAH